MVWTGKEKQTLISITCELDREEELKNGDEVTISVSCDEEIEPYCDQEITDELNGTFFIMDVEDSYRFDKDDVLSFEGITYGTEAISVRLPDSSYTSLVQADSQCLGEIRTNYDLVPVTLQ